MLRYHWNPDWYLTSSIDDEPVLFNGTNRSLRLHTNILTALHELTTTPAPHSDLVEALATRLGVDVARSRSIDVLLERLAGLGTLTTTNDAGAVLLVNSMRKDRSIANNFDGLARLARILAHAGIDARVFDCSIESDDANYAAVLKAAQYDVIGFSTYTPAFDKTIERIAVAKLLQPRARIMLGGPDASVRYASILQCYPFIDLVAIGEAERTVVGIVQFLLGYTDDAAVPGAAYRRGGEVIATPGPIETDLSRIPLPDIKSLVNWTPDVNIEYYRIKTSRGCSSHCSFCASKTTSGTRIRYLPIADVIEEMRWAQTVFNPSGYYVCDDTFSDSPKRVREFCDAIARALPSAKWMCNAKIEDINTGFLETIKAAGCTALFIGLETLNELTLDEIGKQRGKADHSIEATFEKLRLCLRGGLRLNLSLIIGLPNETYDDILRTFETLRRFLHNEPQGDMVVISTPFIALFPGTRLSEEADKHGYRTVDSRYESLATRPTSLPRRLTASQMIKLAAYFGKEYSPA